MASRILVACCLLIAVTQWYVVSGPWSVVRAQSPATDQAPSQGRKAFTSPGGVQLRVLVDAASLGGSEVEIAELTFPANSESAQHQHSVTETFYVLEGELTQVVNGKPVKLAQGQATSIRPTDHVVHRAGAAGAKVLVIWAPGGEIARVTARWKPSQD